MLAQGSKSLVFMDLARLQIKSRGRGEDMIHSNANSSQSPLSIWAESFIFSGSSALLLLIANAFHQYWYLSFFALIPFLLKTIKAGPKECLRLGFLLGLSFFGASVVNSLMVTPLIAILHLFAGTVLFALFGWAVGCARQRWGFNPTIVAVLWVVLELGFMRLGLVGGLLGEMGASAPILRGLIGLFGFLTISAIIVLLNSILVLVLVKTLEVSRIRAKIEAEEGIFWDFSFLRNLFTEKVYLVPEGRAPPLIAF
jgi:apolipoprotein N-acyltransferase